MDGIGSINDYIEAFENAVEPTDKVSIYGCASLELVTIRDIPGIHFDADEEIAQYLSIGADGPIQFHANTYHNGPGHYGIGRVMNAQISQSTFLEITRLLDTWLFTRDENWLPSENAGKWYLKIRCADGKEQIYRGSLDGAFLDGIDISWFMRQRIPIDQLFLFDQYI